MQAQISLLITSSSQL